MKSSTATLLIIATAASTATLAQDGQGHGPPRLTSVVFVSPATNSAQTDNLTKLFQPVSVLASRTN